MADYTPTYNEFGRRLVSGERFVPRDPESIDAAYNEGVFDGSTDAPEKEYEEFESCEEFDAYLKGYEYGQEGVYEPEDWIVEEAFDAAEYLEGPPPRVQTVQEQDARKRARDKRYVTALNHLESAIQILDQLRREDGDLSSELPPGERELWSAYNIIQTKRPMIS